MTASMISRYLGIMCDVLLVATIVWLPLRIPKHVWAFILYSVGILACWWVYMLAGMSIDYMMRIDIPGFGYFAVGFIAWILGVIIFVVRCRFGKRKEPKPNNLPQTSSQGSQFEE